MSSFSRVLFFNEVCAAGTSFQAELPLLLNQLITVLLLCGGAEAVSSCRGFLEGAIRRAEEEIIIWKFEQHLHFELELSIDLC
ncbi:hypothetical protein ACJX0J_021917, partial [Zea mays]